MPPVFKAKFDGVLTFYPGQVVGELPTVVGQEAKFSPTILAEGVVRDVIRRSVVIAAKIE